MIGLYHPGSSLLHRIPAGAKVLVFAALTLAIALTAGGAWTLPAAGCLTAVLYLLAGLGIRPLLRQLCAARWIVLVMLVTQVIFLPVPVALTNTGRVLIVIVLAALITLTTRIPALLDATERALAPFRRFGVNPAAIGLLLALTITVIPVIGGFAAAIREAQRARGAPVRLQRFVVPLLVMSLKHSDELADALTARGIE
ncbi:energy-coupling factor transporter transmembrane component T family protein [Glaciihabitans sp. GrIS 2.15]|uniref:energy-coupling factor transporter transmembrane component T family protein n=1 Tax=Glaciihabitans sp. GrIS 2.15 TaxID=3071710 RepID=UPI002DF89DCD|nr:biotin transport system permease protein [Glaciihabitans sp. GrIS 2.15]